MLALTHIHPSTLSQLDHIDGSSHKAKSNLAVIGCLAIMSAALKGINEQHRLSRKNILFLAKKFATNEDKVRHYTTTDWETKQKQRINHFFIIHWANRTQN